MQPGTNSVQLACKLQRSEDVFTLAVVMFDDVKLKIHELLHKAVTVLVTVVCWQDKIVGTTR